MNDDARISRQAIEQQLDELRQDRQRQQIVRPLLNQLVTDSPMEFRPWLRAVVDTRITDEAISEVGSDIQLFCRDIMQLGLVRGVLYNIDQIDADAKAVRRGAGNRLPDDEIIWPVISHAVEHETDAYWRDRAFKWTPKYAPHRDAAVAILSQGMDDGSPIAALYLCELLPETEGVARAVAASLDSEWTASTAIESWSGITGAGLAAIALAMLKTDQYIGALRKAVLAPRSEFPTDADRALAVDALYQVCSASHFTNFREEIIAAGLGRLLAQQSDQRKSGNTPIGWCRPWEIASPSSVSSDVAWGGGVDQIWDAVMRKLGVRRTF